MLQAMPETAITPKSPSSSLSASTSSREESGHFSVENTLARCVRRKFHVYSQLPIRCQRPNRYYRPPRTSFKLAGLGTINRTASINTAKSCPDNATCASMFRVIGTPHCKKSLSMIDLSASVMEAENGNFRSDSSSIVEMNEEVDRVNAGNEVGIGVGIKKWMDGFVAPEPEEGSSRYFQNPRKAASMMCRVLMLNAWRRRRGEVLYLRDTIDNLHLQIFVLRRLIDTENIRICKMTGEVHRVKMQFDETSKEKDALRTVTASETLAAERGAMAEKAESVTEDLQMRLAMQIALVESSQRQIQRYSKELKAKQDEKSKLEKFLRSSEETGKSLKLRTAFLETQLADRETNLRRLESAYNSQMSELNELRERLIRQSQEGGWSSRMLQIAGSVVRAPRAILRTLLSTTNPALTS
ncbi:uncharacterized protein LOC143371080 isoform X2 [Andrena cerasifolii]|uniref:uncharacterized protein LOC143371080 isoform X2 n=1 Tax=Andrena cerasifolii TaxID=2819439 RepID=UPI004037F285